MRGAVSVTEINFDGLVGPTHNFAGLSQGNLAATAHAGSIAYPRAAALQGLAKMRANLSLGLVQGLFVPPPRPNTGWLEAVAFTPGSDPALLAAGWSASAMWAANAATVSPAADTANGRCHLTTANLATMPHRSHEWPDTLRQLRLCFADPHFAVHAPIPACFGDEGAANHLRLSSGHDTPGVEVFVYGRSGGPFPARQHEQASRAVARRHEVRHALFAEQHPAAIAAGAFHNDVVAVANGHVLLAHERAFADPEPLFAGLRAVLPDVEIIVIAESELTLEQAVASYLFNAQLVTLPTGGMALIVPGEAWAGGAARAVLDRLVAGNGPIRQVMPVELDQSMANGGGPACLRLRVVADPVHIDTRFLLDDRTLDALEQLVACCWPEEIAPSQLGDLHLAAEAAAARYALLDLLNLSELA